MLYKTIILLTIFLSESQPIERKAELSKSNLAFHRVLLSEWKEATNAEDVAYIESLFIRISKEVKGMDDVKFRKLTQGRYHHQTILRFSSKEALEGYEKHPLHDSLRIVASTKVKHAEFFNYWE